MNVYVQLLFGGLISFIGGVLVMQFQGIRNDLSGMTESVNTLNLQIAEVIKDQGWHKDELISIKERLIILERKG